MTVYAISYHWSFSTLPENTRKSKGFLMYSGVSKETSDMKWVETWHAMKDGHGKKS